MISNILYPIWKYNHQGFPPTNPPRAPPGPVRTAPASGGQGWGRVARAGPPTGGGAARGGAGGAARTALGHQRRRCGAPRWRGDRLGCGHIRILNKAPEEYTNTRNTLQSHTKIIQSPHRQYKARQTLQTFQTPKKIIRRHETSNKTQTY